MTARRKHRRRTGQLLGVWKENSDPKGCTMSPLYLQHCRTRRIARIEQDGRSRVWACRSGSESGGLATCSWGCAVPVTCQNLPGFAPRQPEFNQCGACLPVTQPWGVVSSSLTWATKQKETQKVKSGAGGEVPVVKSACSLCWGPGCSTHMVAHNCNSSSRSSGTVKPWF